MSPLLILWDIDHTLIETRGVGRAIYERVFPLVTGTPLEQLATIGGRTELDIMRETLRINGHRPDEELVGKLAAGLVRGYQDARDELAAVGRVLPGARETLIALAREPTVHQAVLSGNLREVARIKLEVFGLDRYLDLTSSAYGDDHAERAALVAIARDRAETATGCAYAPQQILLVGDTPNDVTAARAAGAGIVAVASGKSSQDDLRRAGADQVLPDLTQGNWAKWLQ